MVYGCLKEEWRDVMFLRQSEQIRTKIACLLHSKLPFSFLFQNQPRLRAGQPTDTLVKHLEALENKEAAAVRCRWQCMDLPMYRSMGGAYLQTAAQRCKPEPDTMLLCRASKTKTLARVSTDPGITPCTPAA